MYQIVYISFLEYVINHNPKGVEGHKWRLKFTIEIKKKYNKNLLLKDKENTNAAASYCTVVSR